jgi:uncharacterized protein (TIGR02246 family)
MELPEALVDGFIDAFNTHDAPAFGRLFAEDADWVNVVGIRVTGRDDIQAEHDEAFTTYFRHSALTATEQSVRRLQDGFAVVHFRWALMNEGDAAGDRESEPRRGIIVIVATEEPEGWRIKVGQNTNSFVPGR